MERLSKFKKDVLKVLNNLQNCCDVVESYKHNAKSGIIFSFGDMLPPLKGQDNLRDVMQYLNKNGLDISITFDLDSDPQQLVRSMKFDSVESVPLGLIKGKNLKSIQEAIRDNIEKLHDQLKAPVSQDVTKRSTTTSKKKQKFVSSVIIKDDSLYFGEERIPAEAGQKSLAMKFLTNAKEYRGDSITKNGNAKKLSELQEAGGYADKKSFRDGLKKLRGKLRKSKWPIKIENTGAGRYQMVIKYAKNNKAQQR